jgi:hypothetical protein
MTEVKLNGVSIEEDPKMVAARMARVEKARLRQMFNDPAKGPSARFAHDNWEHIFKFLIEERRKGTHPDLVVIAFAQLFTQAIVYVAKETSDPHATAKLAIDATMHKLTQCFRAAKPTGGPRIIMPHEVKPSLVRAETIIDPKKIKA